MVSTPTVKACAARTQRRLPLPSLSDETTDSFVPTRQDEKPVWHLCTRTATIQRTPGQKLGMTVFSAVGAYGTRVQVIQPDSAVDRAGLQPDDVFVRLNGEIVLHCNNLQLVAKLATMPEQFEVEFVESTQMPTVKGRYVVKIQRYMDNMPGPIRSSAALIVAQEVDGDENFESPSSFSATTPQDNAAFNFKPLSPTALADRFQ
jgi:hypothetical protein